MMGVLLSVLSNADFSPAFLQKFFFELLTKNKICARSAPKNSLFRFVFVSFYIQKCFKNTKIGGIR